MSGLICPICGNEFVATGTVQIYCSKKCNQTAYRRKSTTKVSNLKKVGLEVSEEEIEKKYGYNGRYCPMSCPNYSGCSKRGKDEFEYTSTGSGRWRALRNC